jgi:hypothetical protein
MSLRAASELIDLPVSKSNWDSSIFFPRVEREELRNFIFDTGTPNMKTSD